MVHHSIRFALAVIVLFGCGAAAAQSAKEMSFFVTSVGLGKGGDLGGLEGADKHCLALATAAGAAPRTWRAYLSVSSPALVNARDRIGKGPWQNAKGFVVAKDLEHLHGANALDRDSALDERGRTVDSSRHQILTGSRESGRAYPADRGDRNCGNWTSSGEGVAIVGHHDRTGLATDQDAKSWNTAHRTRGCSQSALTEAGGAGLFYCFAAD
jgi:hypothetical protein